LSPAWGVKSKPGKRLTGKWQCGLEDDRELPVNEGALKTECYPRENETLEKVGEVHRQSHGWFKEAAITACICSAEDEGQEESEQQNTTDDCERREMGPARTRFITIEVLLM